MRIHAQLNTTWVPVFVLFVNKTVWKNYDFFPSYRLMERSCFGDKYLVPCWYFTVSMHHYHRPCKRLFVQCSKQWTFIAIISHLFKNFCTKQPYFECTPFWVQKCKKLLLSIFFLLVYTHTHTRRFSANWIMCVGVWKNKNPNVHDILIFVFVFEVMIF